DLVTAGFQGDFHTLHVDDASPQTGAVPIIQEGINMVSGSTVLVGPGTYAGGLVVNIPVIIIGAGMGSTTITNEVTITAPDSVDRVELRDLSVLAVTSPYIIDTSYAIRIDGTTANTAP